MGVYKLTELINKLEERGVLSNRRAKALRRLAKLLDSPAGRLVRHVAVRLIAHIVLDSIRGR